MTVGHLAVVVARARTLEIELRVAIRRAQVASAHGGFGHDAVWRLNARACSWEAQRLRSAIEKAITRRPRDPRTGERSTR